MAIFGRNEKDKKNNKQDRENDKPDLKFRALLEGIEATYGRQIGRLEAEVRDLRKQIGYLKTHLGATRSNLREAVSGRALVPFFRVFEGESEYFKNSLGFYLDGDIHVVYATPGFCHAFNTTTEAFDKYFQTRLFNRSQLGLESSVLEIEIEDVRSKLTIVPRQFEDNDGNIYGTFVRVYPADRDLPNWDKDDYISLVLNRIISFVRGYKEF